MALESVFVVYIRLRQPSDKHVAMRVYDHFYWPVIRGVTRSHLLGHFCYSFKSTINYVNADICWFKDMILLGTVLMCTGILVTGQYDLHS